MARRSVLVLVRIWGCHIQLMEVQNGKTCWKIIQFSSVQPLSHVRLFATPWIAAGQASLSITNSRSSLKLTSIESVMPSNHLIFYRPLLLLPPIPPNIRVFSNESALLMKWPKYWSFSFSIIPSKALGSNKAEDVCILRPSHPTPKYTPSRNMYICSSKLRCKNWSKQH